jgi:hypothetical protein
MFSATKEYINLSFSLCDEVQELINIISAAHIAKAILLIAAYLTKHIFIKGFLLFS